MPNNSFALLELPDGRRCVAKVADAGSTLIAGSFAALNAPLDMTGAPPDGPVGVFESRDAAERAIDRAAPAPASPLAPFAPWLRAS